jgi:hypothetical protein
MVPLLRSVSAEDVLGELAGVAGGPAGGSGRGGGQGSFDEQHELVGEVCGARQAEPFHFAGEELVQRLAVLPGDGVCGTGLVGEGEVGAEVAAAAEVRCADDLVEQVEDGQQPLAWIVAGGGDHRPVPAQVLGGGAAQHLGDQAVLAAEVFVQRAAGHVRRVQQRVDADVDALLAGMPRVWQAVRSSCG